MRILITGVGGPTPRSFAIALKKYSAYKSFELIGTDSNPLSIGLYQKELFSKSFVVPGARNSNYWSVINKIVSDNNIELAVILPELEVLEWSKRLSDQALPCKALIPDHSLAEVLVDKGRTTEVLCDSGLVPPSVEFGRDTNDFDSIGKKLKYPFWVRSTSGTSGLGSLKVDDADALSNWIKMNSGVQKFIASKFLPGRNLACKLLYYKGALKRAASAERVNYIMAKVAPSGITGNTSFGRLLNEPQLVHLAGQIMDTFFNHSGARKHGFFTLDFKEDEHGKPFLTEINIRHVAFTQCFAAGGANFAEDTIRLLNDDPTFEQDFREYAFEKDLIFLRDVDNLPILMKEKDLLVNLSD